MEKGNFQKLRVAFEKTALRQQIYATFCQNLQILFCSSLLKYDIYHALNYLSSIYLNTINSADMFSFQKVYQAKQ